MKKPTAVQVSLMLENDLLQQLYSDSKMSLTFSEKAGSLPCTYSSSKAGLVCLSTGSSAALRSLVRMRGGA